ncbi:hypothetical protein ACFPJ1_40855 [Kribbella qitaiheensis]|uniref:hypothetical protein n=1 Tax=Kribbella qitaiheensis TaxID=1544730 RepID=UPI00362197E4
MIHNLIGRVLLVVGIAGVVAYCLTGRSGVLHWVLGLGGILLVFISAWMGRIVEVDDE